MLFTVETILYVQVGLVHILHVEKNKNMSWLVRQTIHFDSVICGRLDTSVKNATQATLVAVWQSAQGLVAAVRLVFQSSWDQAPRW